MAYLRRIELLIAENQLRRVISLLKRASTRRRWVGALLKKFEDMQSSKRQLQRLFNWLAYYVCNSKAFDAAELRKCLASYYFGLDLWSSMDYFGLLSAVD